MIKIQSMEKVLEESGKWFLNASLIIFATLIVQPIAQEKVKTEFVIKAGISIIILFAIGLILLYLSKKKEENNGLR